MPIGQWIDSYKVGAGDYIVSSKILEKQEDGTLLAKYSASPEQCHNDKYYHTKGCAFDQQMIYQCWKDTVKAAEILGINDSFIEFIKENLSRLSPVLIGKSGQIKEFREEDYYGQQRDGGVFFHATSRRGKGKARLSAKGIDFSDITSGILKLVLGFRQCAVLLGFTLQNGFPQTSASLIGIMRHGFPSFQAIGSAPLFLWF